MPSSYGAPLARASTAGEVSQLNPVVVIPSYWAEVDRPTKLGERGIYDHATPIAKPVPELETCLSSLEGVRGVLRVIVLLVAPAEYEASARARVDSICRTHQELNPLVIGSQEAAQITAAVRRIAPRMDQEPASLRGYGAIRNMGLAVAAALGHDIVVFLDDDEVALNDAFLIDAVYGLGLSTRQGLTICAKSGCFLNRNDSPYAPQERPMWCDRLWSKRAAFNEWMRKAQSGTRISRSNHVCGGCFALTSEAFCKVAFDPIITRGEDLDYLFDLRMYGLDVWFDNQWRVRHLPPKTPSYAARFTQDVYRWEYEVSKIALANATIGSHPIRPQSLRPYPAPWIAPDVHRRSVITSFRRMLCGPERRAYLYLWLRGCARARDWARDAPRGYFELMTYWPQVMSSLWDDKALAARLVRTGQPKVREAG